MHAYKQFIGCSQYSCIHCLSASHKRTNDANYLMIAQKSINILPESTDNTLDNLAMTHGNPKTWWTVGQLCSWDFRCLGWE